jgi:hypothetical protein
MISYSRGYNTNHRLLRFVNAYRKGGTTITIHEFPCSHTVESVKQIIPYSCLLRPTGRTVNYNNTRVSMFSYSREFKTNHRLLLFVKAYRKNGTTITIHEFPCSHTVESVTQIIAYSCLLRHTGRMVQLQQYTSFHVLIQ